MYMIPGYDPKYDSQNDSLYDFQYRRSVYDPLRIRSYTIPSAENIWSSTQNIRSSREDTPMILYCQFEIWKIEILRIVLFPIKDPLFFANDSQDRIHLIVYFITHVFEKFQGNRKYRIGWIWNADWWNRFSLSRFQKLLQMFERRPPKGAKEISTIQYR